MLGEPRKPDLGPKSGSGSQGRELWKDLSAHHPASPATDVYVHMSFKSQSDICSFLCALRLIVFCAEAVPLTSQQSALQPTLQNSKGIAWSVWLFDTVMSTVRVISAERAGVFRNRY